MKRAQWVLLAFLTFLNVLNFVDRQLIPSLAPKLMADLGLNRAEIGLLYGYVFIVFYTAVGLWLGTVADRWHRPRLIAMGLGLWSALTAVTGAALNFSHLALARIFIGIGEAALTPAALSMLSDTFPLKRRAFASGTYYAGVPIGSAFSAVVSGWIATRYGWRACFYALGILGVLVVPLALLFRNPQREGGAASEPAGTTRDIYRSLFHALRSSAALRLAMLGGIMLNYYTASNNHIPTFLVTERGFDFERASYVGGGILLLMGVLGVVLGGAMSDWFHRRWRGGRMYFLIFNTAVMFPCSLAFFLLPAESPLFYPAWAMAIFGSMVWYGPIFATVADLAPPRVRSTALAFMILLLNMLGTGSGAWITGLLGDAYSLELGLSSGAAVGLCAVVPLFFAARKYAAHREAATAAG